jgi:hypothetical protein
LVPEAAKAKDVCGDALQFGFVLDGVEDESWTRYPRTETLSEAVKAAMLTVVEAKYEGKAKAVIVGATPSTETVAEEAVVPNGFVAVRVKSVVEVGFAVHEPARVDVLKEPGVIATDEAFVVTQASVEVPGFGM